jgi:hypothetical protein
MLLRDTCRERRLVAAGLCMQNEILEVFNDISRE